MVTWNDSQPSATPSGPPARRFVSRIRTHWTALPAAKLLAASRAGLAAVFVVAVLSSAIGFGREDAAPPGPNVAAPTLLQGSASPAPSPPTVPVPDHEDAAGARSVAPLRAPAATYAQVFAASKTGPAEACRALAGIGFSQARWKASQVFSGEWECASGIGDARTGSAAFVVLRGARKNTASSLMLKLSPATAADHAPLAALADRVATQALARVGLLVTPRFEAQVAAWNGGEIDSTAASARIAAEYGSDRQILNFTLSPPLPAPKPPCAAPSDCGRWTPIAAGGSGSNTTLARR